MVSGISEQPNVPRPTIPPSRSNISHRWEQFAGGEVCYEFDVWLDSQNGNEMNRLNQFFTDNITVELLRSQLESFHSRAFYDELSDEWILNTLLGQRLREHNFRVLAFIERVRQFDPVTFRPTVRCSLLVETVPVRGGRLSL